MAERAATTAMEATPCKLYHDRPLNALPMASHSELDTHMAAWYPK